MKEKIIQLGQWGQQNWLPLIIILSCTMMLFLVAVMVSWLIGYWCNALRGTHFELASCWSGISVVVTGLAGVASLAGACWTKYHTDSKFNTPAGFPPVVNRFVDKGGNANDGRN